MSFVEGEVMEEVTGVIDRGGISGSIVWLPTLGVENVRKYTDRHLTMMDSGANISVRFFLKATFYCLQDLEMVIKCLICKAPFKKGRQLPFHRRPYTRSSPERAMTNFKG
ncbi:hypothetical protein NQ317_015207 [Molorchus minor]|uniref:Uncharacterized protein n=1 Tax=Molorchus minor TaxID=1323400 RepID=A0ABQ9JCJ8_9CUCU|nr:hypothetical protein NQ317_015207 [Molorchus minor]